MSADAIAHCNSLMTVADPFACINAYGSWAFERLSILPPHGR